jgi:hypothetical protein
MQLVVLHLPVKVSCTFSRGKRIIRKNPKGKIEKEIGVIPAFPVRNGNPPALEN